MASETLTSLAMLKVSIDQGGDYLDYLKPFVLQVLADKKPDPVTDRAIRELIKAEFGLEIPERALQIVLKRMSKKYPIKKDEHVYRIDGELPSPGIAAKRANAARHIQTVVSGLVEFSQTTPKPFGSSDQAVSTICAFLSEFNIPCLRAYLRGTAIPAADRKHGGEIVMVSQYVVHLQQNDAERFESFIVVLQGHMLANALLCPDLQNAPKTYKGMVFYLDTPLLVRLLGAEGEAKRAATENLVKLLQNLGGTVAAFSHSRNELGQVLNGAAEHIGSSNGRGAIITEARRNSTTKSDLLMLAGKIDELLNQHRVEVKSTPPYVPKFQIDESAFEKALDNEVSYLNPRARECDISSVRSVYVLRGHSVPTTLERADAVVVTSNLGFARAAYDYGKDYEQSREVSSVITDFSLANMAWLKAPMGAPDIPTTELLAFSYAALQPSGDLLDKFLGEIDKLEKIGRITIRDHQLLRGNIQAQEELMRLTLGDDAALTEETVIETLRRVSSEIKKEERGKLIAEQQSHRETQVRLTCELAEKKKVQQRIYWRCYRRAKQISFAGSGVVLALLIAGLLVGIGLRTANPKVGLLLALSSGALFVFSAANFLIGVTVRNLQSKIQSLCLRWLIARESVITGIDVSGVER